MQIELTNRNSQPRASLANFGKPDDLHGDVGLSLGGVFDMNAQYRPVFLNAQFDANTLRSRMATNLAINKQWTDQKASSALYAEANAALDAAPGMAAQNSGALSAGYVHQGDGEESSYGVNATKPMNAPANYSAFFMKPVTGGQFSADVGYSQQSGPRVGVNFSKRF